MNQACLVLFMIILTTILGSLLVDYQLIAGGQTTISEYAKQYWWFSACCAVFIGMLDVTFLCHVYM